MAIQRRLKSRNIDTPLRSLPGIEGCWNFSEGEHLSLNAWENLAAAIGKQSVDGATLYTLGLPWRLPTHAHHTVEDRAYLVAAGESVDSYPVAPLFIRDLAGRTILTPLVPHVVPPESPVLPEGCKLLSVDEEGVDLLEQVFLVSFRRLEMAAEPGLKMAAAEGINLRAIYASSHLYPYKIRVDSFYQDGFRIPQTQRLFVKEGKGEDAKKKGEDILKKWAERPQGQPYEEFYEKNNGTEWFAALFNEGCTVIPTFEAFNGFFKVTRDFGMEDVWPGRAVRGLHAVVEERDDPSPRGTILNVVEPGYAVQGFIKQAKVVVSNGSGYKSTHEADPRPLLPNLKLPHPRVSSQWGRVWIPTHPRHFENPLIWDWSESGDFQQVSGPLWDPVHYYYASTPHIIKAFRKPWEENPNLAKVPAHMLPRFHPIVAMTTYDTVNTLTQSYRSQQWPKGPLSESALDTVTLPYESAQVGYHPLPAALEYEMDPSGKPWLNPKQRKVGNPSAGQKERLAPVIQPSVTSDEARKMMVILPEGSRQILTQPVFFPEKGGGFPDLKRYEDEEVAQEEKCALLTCYLPDAPQAELSTNVKRFFANRQYRQELGKVDENLPAAFYAFREEALAWRRLRYRLLRKYPAQFCEAWWQGMSLEMAESLDQTTYERLHPLVRKALSWQRGAGKSVPALVATVPSGALPVKRSSAKIETRIHTEKPQKTR